MLAVGRSVGRHGLSIRTAHGCRRLPTTAHESRRPPISCAEADLDLSRAVAEEERSGGRQTTEIPGLLPARTEVPRPLAQDLLKQHKNTVRGTMTFLTIDHASVT